jgi:hypothetical protein
VDTNQAALAMTQFYDPGPGTWTAGPPTVEARYSGMAVSLGDGRILVMGGSGSTNAALRSAELYGD